MEGYLRMKECHNAVSGINEALKNWSKMKTGNMNDLLMYLLVAR